MAEKKVHQLRKGAKFALFVSSYLPLFGLLVIRQLVENQESLNWGGLNVSALLLFFSKFGLSVVLSLTSGLGVTGLCLLLQNLKLDVKNGDRVKITEVQNRNSEAVSYISTYIVPFLFQNYGELFELFAICFLLFIIYEIYINSSLLLINPFLSLRYSLYDLKFIDQSQMTKSGMVITKNRYLEEQDTIKIYPIGHKLYFSET